MATPRRSEPEVAEFGTSATNANAPADSNNDTTTPQRREENNPGNVPVPLAIRARLLFYIEYLFE
jgi:hypothetical protein